MSNIQAITTHPNAAAWTYPSIVDYDWSRRYREALEDIINLLGPEAGCDGNDCEGCQYEMAEALRVAKIALGQHAERPNWPPHRKKPPK